MSVGDLLNIQPTELKLPFELRKQSSCFIRLTNKSDKYVAYKVKTTNPKKYCVRPNMGTIMPGASCNVTVTMQAQKETPPDMQCKDKFLIQSIAAPDGASSKDITTDTFVKQDGKVVEEFKLRVVYIPANPPSPVPEESEEELSPRSPVLANGNEDASPLKAAPSLDDLRDKSSETWSTISKLTEEKATALQQNQQLEQELDLIRKQVPKNRAGGLSLMIVLLVGVLSILAGYLVKRT
ncbi:vesicle-associated protein 1-3-like [Euphorbia lathyris]|uniref:vesicle-associated protein 1-3-like n=1 Tax=Euphorbia lathyris TaxID=212925 RepID=UPI0033140F13